MHFWNPCDTTNNLTLFLEKSEHVSISDPCGTFRSMAAILEMQNVAYAFINLSAKSHSLNILFAIYVLSCSSTTFVTAVMMIDEL